MILRALKGRTINCELNLVGVLLPLQGRKITREDQVHWFANSSEQFQLLECS